MNNQESSEKNKNQNNSCKQSDNTKNESKEVINIENNDETETEDYTWWEEMIICIYNP